MNKFIGMGRLVRDPDVRFTESKMCIVRYTIAVNRTVKRDGEPDADFINCIAFGKSGEFAEKYLKKGVQVLVSGRIQTGSYTNRDGNKVYTTDVIIESQEFTEKKPEAPKEAQKDEWMNIPESIEKELPFS